MSTKRPQRVYVASSWRNTYQPAVIHVLRAAGIDCYDFRNPHPGNDGFSWGEVMPSWRGVNDQDVPADEYINGLYHPRAVEGYDLDFAAMNDCDACVLVLPCGKSAHLELGWFVGQGRRTAILLEPGDVQPELMYKMVDYIATSLFDLLGWLGVDDEHEPFCDACVAGVCTTPHAVAVGGDTHRRRQ